MKQYVLYTVCCPWGSIGPVTGSSSIVTGLSLQKDESDSPSSYGIPISKCERSLNETWWHRKLSMVAKNSKLHSAGSVGVCGKIHRVGQVSETWKGTILASLIGIYIYPYNIQKIILFQSWTKQTNQNLPPFISTLGKEWIKTRSPCAHIARSGAY